MAAVTPKWKIENIQFRDPVNLGNVSNDFIDFSRNEYAKVQVEEKGAFLVFTGIPGAPRRARVPLSNVVQINEREEAPVEQPAKEPAKEPPKAPPPAPIGPGGVPLPAARVVTEPTS